MVLRGLQIAGEVQVMKGQLVSSAVNLLNSLGGEESLKSFRWARIDFSFGLSVDH